MNWCSWKCNTLDVTQKHRVGILALQFQKAPIVRMIVDKKPRRPVESTLRWKSGNVGNAARDAFCLPRGCRAFSARGAGYAELPTMLDRIDCSALPGSVKIAGNPLTGGVTMLQPFPGERSDIHLSRKCLEAVNSPRCQTLTYEKSLWLDPLISCGFDVWNIFGRTVSQTCCIYKYFADCQLLLKLGR